MSRSYGEDVLEIAIRHAGHEVLRGESPEIPPDDGDMRMPLASDRKMRALIRREAARRGAGKAFKIALRVAAVAAAAGIVFSAMVLSSGAFRAAVFNIFSRTGESQTSLQFVSACPDDLPEGIILPAYMPEGFTLVKTSKENQYIESFYRNDAGDRITIEQHTSSMQISVGSRSSTVVEIEGKSVYLTESEEYATVIFNTDISCMIIHGTVDSSELLKIAESILVNHC
jgi:hypothetical protein